MDNTSSNNTPVTVKNFAYDMVYYVLWIVEVFLFLRFALKLLGANPSNQIVAFLYSLALALMGPFRDIFGSVAITGNSILEPSILVAMVVYALIAHLLISFIKIISAE